LVAGKSRTFEPLALKLSMNIAVLIITYFCFLLEDKASLELSAKIKHTQRYQNGDMHQKLKRKGSNVRARRARHALRKFTEIYGNPRARRVRYALIFSRPKIQYDASSTAVSRTWQYLGI
jgi:hypothetical protein